MSWTVQGSIPSKDKTFLSSPKCSDWLRGPPSLINGYQGFFRRGPAAGHEGIHSPPFSAKVKNEWNYTYTTPIGVHRNLLFYITFGTPKLDHKF
jgi:hypothetical protein